MLKIMVSVVALLPLPGAATRLFYTTSIVDTDDANGFKLVVNPSWAPAVRCWEHLQMTLGFVSYRNDLNNIYCKIFAVVTNFCNYCSNKWQFASVACFCKFFGHLQITFNLHFWALKLAVSYWKLTFANSGGQHLRNLVHVPHFAREPIPRGAHRSRLSDAEPRRPSKAPQGVPAAQ